MPVINNQPALPELICTDLLQNAYMYISLIFIYVFVYLLLIKFLFIYYSIFVQALFIIRILTNTP